MPVVAVLTNYPTQPSMGRDSITRAEMINRSHVTVVGPFKTRKQAIRAASALREESDWFGDSPCDCIDENDTKKEQKKKMEACTCWESEHSFSAEPPWDSTLVWQGAGGAADCIEVMPQAMHEDDMEADEVFMAGGRDEPALGVTARQRTVARNARDKAARKRSAELEAARTQRLTKQAEAGGYTKNATQRVRALKRAMQEYNLSESELELLPFTYRSNTGRTEQYKVWNVRDLAQARDKKQTAAEQTPGAKRTKIDSGSSPDLVLVNGIGN